MRCPIQNGESPGILLDYCARTLNSDAAAVLERHIAVCPECARFAAAQQQLWSALDSWEATPVADDFDERLYARIEESNGWSRVRRWFGEWKPAVPFAAAAATAALAFFLNLPATNPGVPVQERSRIEALEPEQIERAVEDVDMLRQFSTPGPQSL
jgi:anti-sigma factor RsiW